MALFGKKRKACGYDILREGEDTVLYIYCEDCAYSPSIEDSSICFGRTIEKLMENAGVTKVIFSQKRDYEYDYNQTQMLVEIANLYKKLTRMKNVFSYQSLGGGRANPKYVNEKYVELQNSILRKLKSDPIGAYVEAKRILRREKISHDKLVDPTKEPAMRRYIQIVDYFVKVLEQTKLIAIAGPYLPGYKIGDRTIYRNIFYPAIKPDFMFTKLMANYPTDGEEIDNYSLDEDTDVTIFKSPNSVKYLYHLVPPEFKLSEEKYELLDLARKIMSEHKPKEDDFVDPERMRQVFYNVGRDLLEELATHKKQRLTSKEIEKLTQILVRYTIGFGLIEVLLSDENVQDISINSPMGKIPMFLVHSKYDDCDTNIIPTKGEAESWASKLRMISGRPLDEANPILDTELELPQASTRVAVISRPLNPTGLAYSFRRHRDKPWTLPLFIKTKMISPTAAGLISFLVDGTRTMLIAGTRSAGKSSLLSAILVEIMRRYRVITIEDTLELPTSKLRKLGYNIQSMKVASALTRESSEVSASDGIRSTLRLGDSALIVGEVRSSEAKALYEAMRVGAAANVVAGTIHGDTPYGIYDRVVNDIGIPKTSFKATDIMIIANPVRSADGIHKFRRVTQITEVRKHWEEDPLAEKGFSDLMRYNAKTDQLELTDDLIAGDSEVLKIIAGKIKEFSGNWDAMWENILLRAEIKEELVKAAVALKSDALLEAPFVIRCNDQFHIISDRIKNESGGFDAKRISFEWKNWLKSELRKRSMVKK